MSWKLNPYRIKISKYLYLLSTILPRVNLIRLKGVKN